MNCKVCGNTSTKSTSVSFFRFPKENEKCRDWAERCNLHDLYEKNGTLRFYKSFRICSAHFDPKDIVFDGRKKRLLQSALPSLITTKNTKKERVNELKNYSQNEVLTLKLVENMCRLCAKENRDLTDIYGWQGRTLNLEGKLKHFPLMINRYDVLPLRVCHTCISKINQFHDFITRCMKAETQLRLMLDLEACNSSYKLLEPSADEQEKIAQETEINTPNLDAPTVSSSSQLVAHFPESVEDDYYDHVLQNNYINEDSGNCVCEQTNFVGQSQNQPEPGFAKTTNHTNYIKDDFSSTISFEHDYSNIISRDQLQLESKIEIDDEQNFMERTKHPCQICLECFNGSELPNSHDLAQPSTNEELNCKACEKIFFTRMEFETSSHTEEFSACKICDKKSHKVAFHEEHPSENSCDDFSDSRPSQIYLESAEKTRQKKVNCRKRRCQFCDRLFKNRQTCQAHEKSHTGEAPYQCKQCGKQFRSRPSLRQHKAVHSDKRLYNCQECGMSFKRKDTLSNHFRIHTGERPFVCKVCGFAFKQRGDCMKHEKNHQKTWKVDVKLRQKAQICDVATINSVTQDFLKTGFRQAKVGLQSNDNLSPPSYAAEDPVEDVVAGQTISFNF